MKQVDQTGNGMKKHIFIRIIAALFYVVLSGLSGSGSLAQSSDWTELPLPGGAAISALFAGNGVLLAARKAGSQNAGVYRSEDRGQMWNPAPAFELGTDGSAVNCFVAVGNILYSCARGVYRSTDKGQSWTPLNNGLRLSSDPNLVPPIGFIAVSGDLMVAAAAAPHQAVFLSTDGGQNWAERNSGLAIGTNFIYGPATIRNGEFHLWVRSQLYRYQSGLQAWVQIGGQLPQSGFVRREHRRDLRNESGQRRSARTGHRSGDAGRSIADDARRSHSEDH